MLPILSLLLGCGDPVVVADYLTVIHVAPSNGAALVEPDTALHATFNDDLVTDSWVGAVFLDDPSGNPVPSALSYDDQTRTLSLVPDAELEENTIYSFTLADTLEGRGYGRLPAQISTSFKTVGGGVTTGNSAPVAVIDDPGDCWVGDPLALTESSTDADGDLLSYTWRVVVGDAEIDEPSLSSPELTCNAAGDVTIGLVVNDGVSDSSEAFLTLYADDGLD